MKRWTLLTVGLYVLCLSIFTLPLLFFPNGKELLAFFYIGFVPILVLIQVVLLLVPVAVVQERPIKRRKIIVSAALGAFLMGVLGMAFVYSIIVMIWGEDNTPIWPFNTSSWPVWILTTIWLVWGIIFWRSFSSKNPNGFTSTTTRWLLRGSILEVLVAIPSHIISRHRNDCCAPSFTLLGLVMGLSIALMSFGPSVFFLFAKKVRDKRKK